MEILSSFITYRTAYKPLVGVIPVNIAHIESLLAEKNTSAGVVINNYKQSRHYSHYIPYTELYSAVETYANGKLNGVIITLDTQGKLHTEIYCQNGEKHGVCRYYYPTGQIYRECRYSKNLLHGVFVEYYQTSQVLYQGEYYYGQKRGVHQHWYCSGKLYTMRTFSHDVLHGMFYEYDDTGFLQIELNYTNGNAVGRKWCEDLKKYLPQQMSNGPRLGANKSIVYGRNLRITGS